MKLRRIIALVVIATLITIFATTVFAATGASYSYPSGNGEANQVFVSSANADEGLIEPSSVDGNLGEGDTWKFTARPSAGYEFDRWDVSGADNVSGLDASSPVLSFGYKEGGMTTDEANKFSAVANFKQAAAENSEATATPETSVSPEASTEPEASVSPEATTSPEATVSPEATATPEPSVSPEVSKSPQTAMSPNSLGLAAVQNYTLTIQKIGSSSSTNGSTLNPASGTSFPAGTVVDLSATANSSSRFVGFFKTKETSPYTDYKDRIDQITMDGNKTIYALFSSNSYNSDHIDVELDGTIVIDRQVNGVSEPGYPKTLNVTVSHPSATIVAGGSTINVPESKFSIQGAEFRALNLSYRWPSSVSVNATLTDQEGHTYPFQHTFTENEMKAAYALCPGSESSGSKGFDYVLNESQIVNQITHTVTFKTTAGGTLNGGNPDVVVTGVLDGSDCPTPPGISQTNGYAFLGWTKDDGATMYTTAQVDAMTVTADATFTAHFKADKTFRVMNSNGPGNSSSGMGGDHGYIQVKYNGATINLEAGEEHTFDYVPGAGSVEADFVPDSGWSFLYYVIDNGAQHINRDPDSIDPSAYAGKNGDNDRMKLNPKWTTGLYTVTYDANGATEGSVPVDSATYGNDDTVTVLGNTGSLVKEGSSFAGWTMNQDGSGTVYNANDTFTMGNANVTLYAKWNTNTYTVTYNNKDGGFISSETVSFGDPAAHIPTPPTVEGMTFDEWSLAGDNAAYQDSLTVVKENIIATATYTTNAYTVTYNDKDGGFISRETVSFGNAAAHIPTPPVVPGMSFDKWSLTGDNAAYPDSLTVVKENIIATATYTQDDYTIIYDLDGKGTTADQWEFTGKHYNDAFPADPDVTADAGWTFIGWSVDPLPDKVTGNATIVAQYTRTNYAISTSVTNGSITPGRNANYGDNVTIIYSPTLGYHLESITVDGTPLTNLSGYETSYTFSNITSSHSIAVVFAQDTYYISTSVTNGTITPGQTAVRGSDVIIGYAPNTGYHLAGITVDGTPLTSLAGCETSYRFNNIMTNHSIAVVFAKNTYSVTTSATNGTIDAGKTAEYGDDVTINYAPASGYHLAGIVIDNTALADLAGYETSYTFNDIAANHDIKVIFAATPYTVTTAAVNGTITAPQSVNAGTDVTITYNPNYGYHLEELVVDDVPLASLTGHETTYTFEDISANHSITAIFAKNAYLITTSVTNGTITPGQVAGKGDSKTIEYAPVPGYHLGAVIVDGAALTDLTGYESSYTFSDIEADHKISVIYVKDIYTVTTTVTNGTIDPSKTAKYGDDVAINYSPNPGYHLQSVTVDGTPLASLTGFEAVYPFNDITASHSIAVVFAANSYTVTTSATNGTISPDQTAEYGANVGITYSANPGYRLESITVDGTALSNLAGYESSYTFSSIAANHSISVVFAKASYKVTTSAANGTITPNQSAEFGDDVAISYSPNAGYHLQSITIDGTVLTDPNAYAAGYTFNDIAADHTINVVFAVNSYTVSTAVTNGTITPSQTAGSGSDVVISYSPNAGYHLASIAVDGAPLTDVTGYETSYTFNDIAANHSISVVFAEDTYFISTTVAHGTIKPGQPAAKGSDVLIDYTPDAGYHLASIAVDGTPLASLAGCEASYRFSNILTDHSIAVVFEKNLYSITTSATNGTIDSGRVANYGDDVTINYTPASGYHLAGIVIDNTALTDLTGLETSYTFNDVDANHDIKVIFAQTPYTVTTAAVYGSITASQSVNAGADVTITYTPNDGYHLEQLFVDGTPLSDLTGHETSYAFEDIAANHSITAIFQKNQYLITTVVSNGTISPGQTAAKGESRTVTYSPNAGYYLAGVIVDGAAVDASAYESSYTFSDIEADHIISVIYVKDLYTVTTTVSNGTIDPSKSARYGDDVVINYNPNPGYHLESIKVDGTPLTSVAGVESAYAFNDIAASHSIYVVYAKDTYTVTTSATNGTISSDQTAEYGDNVGITYSPNPGYHITGITVDGTALTSVAGYESSYTFSNIAADHSIAVTFSKNAYTVTTSAMNGTITPNQTAEFGDDVAISYSPNTGYHLQSITVDGTVLANLSAYATGYTFSDIAANHTINVEFALNSYTVTTEATNGSITASQDADYGDNVVIDYSPNTGYHIQSITVDNVALADMTGHETSYTFSSISANHSISVVFAEDTYFISTSVAHGTIKPGQSAVKGSDVLIDYTPDTGYHLASIAVDGTQLTSLAGCESSYRFSNILTNHSISVVFAKNTYNVTTSAKNGTIDDGRTAEFGDDVTINYTPASGYHLAGIVIDNTALTNVAGFETSYTFSDIAANHEIKVIFAATPYTVTTSAINGSITPEQNVQPGVDVAITYTANDGYHLEELDVDGAPLASLTGHETTYTFEDIAANHSITAIFAKNQYLITTVVSNGTITPGQKAVKGDSRTIDYSPNAGYHLGAVIVDGAAIDTTGYESSYTFSNIETDHIISVIYVKDLYTVTTTVSNGSIDPSKSARYGDDVVINYSPNSGYHLQSIKVDGTPLTSLTGFESAYAFNDIAASHSIDVVYAKDTYTVTTSATNGTITPSRNAEYGDNIGITYSANTGYHLASITVDGTALTDLTGHETSYSFDNITANHSIAVMFDKNTYTVTTSATNGTITPSLTADDGADVGISYSASTGYHLESITVDGTPLADPNAYAAGYTFNDIAANHTINVVYAVNPYTITTSAMNGTITPSQSADSGDNVTINYSANTGLHLSSIVVDGAALDIAGYQTSYTFGNVTSDHTISVVFEADSYFVTTSAINGTITAGQSVSKNGNATITYSANANYHLAGIVVDNTMLTDLTGYETSYTFSNITANHSILVIYAKDAYAVATSVVNGSITPGRTANIGDDVAITYTANTGYHLQSVTVDGVKVTDLAPYQTVYTFSNITASHSIEVVFAVNPYTVSTSVANGTITPSKSADNGEDVAITYSANPGYHLVGITVDGTPLGSLTGYQSSYTFEDIAADHSIAVVYAANSYMVTTSVTNGTITPSQTAAYGDDVTISFSPNSGYRLAGVTVDGTPLAGISPNMASFTFNDIASSHTIAVTYAQNVFLVTFVDYNGTVLGTDAVEYNAAATAPSNPARGGYAFTGWDKDFSHVTSDMTVTATYSGPLTYTVRFFRADGVTQIGTSQVMTWGSASRLETAPAVANNTFSGWRLTGDNASVPTRLNNVRENIDAVATYNATTIPVLFVDFNGGELGNDNVPYGGDATPPNDPAREGYTFTGWAPNYNNVTTALTVTAQYQINTFTVTFVDYDGDVIDRQTVEWNTGADAPTDPTRDGYEFNGWDVPFDRITRDTTVTAQYNGLGAPSPSPTTIGEEPIPQTGGTAPCDCSWLWWLLLIPGIGLLWLLLAAWFTIIPIAEAVADNGNGTYTVQWGYENRKLGKRKVDRDQSTVTVFKGTLLGSSNTPPVEFEKGRVENVFTTIVDKDAEIQWKIKRRKAKVDITNLEKHN